MKKFMPLFIALLIGTSFATDSVNLKKGDLKLSLIKAASILSADLDYGNCPANAHCMPATSVRVKLTLGGCMDSLGPVTASFHKVSGLNEYKLEMSAVNIHTERSLNTRCVIAKTQIVKLQGPAGMDMNNLKLVMLTENLAASPKPLQMREMGHQ